MIYIDMSNFFQQNYLNLKKSFMTSLNWGLGIREEGRSKERVLGTGYPLYSRNKKRAV